MGLHADEIEAVRQAFLQEMEILSFLRHPNLLLFIGVSYDPATRTPLWIVTELMKFSLYSIIHDLRIELTLAEVIDTAVGVVSGLQVRTLERRMLDWISVMFLFGLDTVRTGYLPEQLRLVSLLAYLTCVRVCVRCVCVCVTSPQYLHEHDPAIIHRDISAKNILLDGNRVKISDLGQAKFVDLAERQTVAPGCVCGCGFPGCLCFWESGLVREHG